MNESDAAPAPHGEVHGAGGPIPTRPAPPNVQDVTATTAPPATATIVPTAPAAPPHTLPSVTAAPESAPAPADPSRPDGVAALPPPPRPKPVIIPERTNEGWSTPSLILRRGSGGFFLGCILDEHKLSIHLSPGQLSSLLGLLEAEPGILWRKLAEIPLERPLPSRALEEELRVMLKKFGPEMGARRG